MPLAPFKFVIQAVLLETDDFDAIVGERVTEPVVLYGSNFAGVAQLYQDKLDALLEQVAVLNENGASQAQSARFTE